MEKAMVVTLIITLLTGFSQEQNILPPGPINKEVGANVLFTIISSPEPVHAIRWHFNGSEVIRYIPPGPEIVNSDYRGRVFLNYSSGDLELKGLSMNDSGQYTIILTFQSGLGVQDHTLLQVFEPVFVISITSPEGNLIEYSSANFTCEGNGTISTTVWMKEYEILAPSSSIQFLDDNRTMVISPVKRSDSGNYQCAMSNPVSSSSAHYSITVNYGPDVRIFGAQTLEEGSDILLLCSPDSVPPATITWTVKGMSTRSAALYVTENSNPSDSGDYNCTCWNNVTGITASAVQVLTVRALTRRDMDSTRPLKVCCGIWQQIFLHGLDLFVQHIPQMIDWIEIWGIWRPSQHLELLVMFLEPFLNNLCSMAGRIILLKEATAIREYCCHEGVYLVCSNV
ncbi:carcinoembryonic antigen-related cell adhesion molecule 1 isoform X2 [Pangasianodon hypophthalmus]|uniref:carcinoembryonic antigen-related cell adhesion molecule 1 isoform X2 n=1 Tax=Pangasianodon hypophthalmus TaxID=310915 RepID=UPI0023076C8E|nr:carcinoembryonic antigen-related cell adhesion molecule 1 isoform X2 [Pangasianodon hypophthalmus]